MLIAIAFSVVMLFIQAAFGQVDMTVTHSGELVFILPINPVLEACYEFGPSNAIYHVDAYSGSSYWFTSYPGEPLYSLTWTGVEWKISHLKCASICETCS